MADDRKTDDVALFPVRTLNHPDLVEGLASCPQCGALMLRGHIQLHLTWHEAVETNIAVAAFL